ncbi:MAG: hypothetical protein HY562_06935 [Ignavibacteriales bacterium]|nr:hypothetical protein [Ignavibacteriales bacterium]
MSLSQEKLLLLIIDRLESLGIPYMITGSIASSYYGRPRTTHDFDFVVEIHQGLILNIVQRFSPEFYVSEEGVLDALRRKSMFNFIHHQSGLKIDFWILDRTGEYDALRFQRRKNQEYFGRSIIMTAPEDLILMKLLWVKESHSDKQLSDVKGILMIQENRLDKDYLKLWAHRLSVSKTLETLMN